MRELETGFDLRTSDTARVPAARGEEGMTGTSTGEVPRAEAIARAVEWREAGEAERFTEAPPGTVSVRRFPFPYRAMLAICSDLDETPDARAYVEIARFLNTTRDTAMGPGVGLEVGNTIYFDMKPDQFAYWNTDDAGRAVVRDMIKSGHIDCLHSFGDLADTRAHAGRALDELARHGCRLKVWVDHAVARTNLGADIMQGEGDVPRARAYHADLTLGHGVEYVWRGRITSVIGQDAPRSLGGILGREPSARCARTFAKEVAKGWLARLGNRKYAMHASNATLRRAVLRDGQATLEFLRVNPFPGGVENAATADGIALALTAPVLERLVEREGTAIVYTHLGKIRSRERPFNEETCTAFRRLSGAHRTGKVLVATTRRLLDYVRMRDAVTVRARREGGALVVAVKAPLDTSPASLAGLTLYVPDPSRTEVTVGGRRVPIDRNGPDATGRPSVSIRWPRLEFPIP